jgi:hypothetical protein
MFEEKYGTLIVDGLIKPSHVFGVPNLKHLSRCVVREVLRENCQLPVGIQALNVPTRVKRYIDLMD